MEIIYLLLPLLLVGIPAALSLDKNGEALFTDIGLELVEGYAVPDQVSDVYLRLVIPFDEKRSGPTPANASKLWRAKVWVSSLKQGGGEKVDFQKQILSDAQAATPFVLSKNPLIIDDIVYPIDLVGHDCSVASYVCVRFQAWDSGPQVLFEFDNGQKLPRGTTCTPLNCTDSTSALDCGEHKDGDRWIEHTDEWNCMMRSCVAGETVTAMVTCEVPPCATPRYPVDSCCPICPEPSPNRCSLEPLKGRCLGYFLRYFHNSSSKACETFVWGGCGGNDNIFEKVEDCQDACAAPEPAVVIEPTVEPEEESEGEPDAVEEDGEESKEQEEESEEEEEELSLTTEVSDEMIVTEMVEEVVTTLVDVAEPVTEVTAIVTKEVEVTEEIEVTEVEAEPVTEVTAIVTKEVEVTEEVVVTEEVGVTEEVEVSEYLTTAAAGDADDDEGKTNVTAAPSVDPTNKPDNVSFDECDGHKEMETWEPEPCKRCSCIEGSVICSSPSCDVQCDDPLPAEGSCCPICPEPESECEEGAESFPDLCTQCVCKDGSEVCGAVECPQLGCLYPRKVAGECCRKCVAPLRARPMNIRTEVTPRVWRAARTMFPRFNVEVRTFPNSENITGTGLWKLSIWVDSQPDGTGERRFYRKQALTKLQASQPIYGGVSINFENVRLPIGGPEIPCPEEIHHYCLLFQKGDSPTPDFRFLAPRQQSSIMRCIKAPCV